MKRGTLLAAAGLALAAIAAVVAVAAVNAGWVQFGGRINTLGVNLREPAAYIDTVSLSALPRDLVKAPVLRNLLTRDFAFYYEEHESRLGLVGALRRIAFEHDQTLADNLLSVALDEPAELAFWSDAKGAPRYWAMAMTRGTLARALQGLSAIATKDKQLTLLGELRLSPTSLISQPVYALRLSTRQVLAIASRGDRVVVMSDPGLLFSTERKPDPDATDVMAALLSERSAEQSVWRKRFGLAGPTRSHTLVADGALLSFGYQPFFPSLKALRFDLSLDGGALRTWVRGPLPQGSTSPWAALPAQPAACVMLPLEAARVNGVLTDAAQQQGDKTKGPGRLLNATDGPGAVCWYDGSQLHTPLVVAHAKGAAPTAAAMAEFMAWWLPGKPSGRDATKPAVVAPYGAQRNAEGQSIYRPRLVRQGEWWIFSPDSALVSRAQDTLARRYPSVAEAFEANASTLAVATPSRASALGERETLALISPEQTAFWQAAQQHWLPRLAALAKLPAAKAVTQGPPDAQGWVAVDWQAIPKEAKPNPPAKP